MSTATTDAVPPIVRDYVNERDELMRKMEFIMSTAKERGKDPTDDDLEIVNSAKARIKKLDGFIEVLGEDMTMRDDVQANLRRWGSDLMPQAPHYRTAGEAMSDFMQATFGNPNDRDHREAKSRWELTMKRVAQHMGTTAAATTPTAGGFGSMFVDPVVGPIINVLPQGQPFLTGVGKQQAPNSLTFLRPSISDPDFDTGASAQGLQKAELVSKKFDVSTDSITLDTVGGYLNVSQQLISLHPTGWDIIINQLRARVARQGELLAIAELANSTGSVSLATGANAATTWAALVEAAGDVATATNMPPTWIAYGPGGWARLAGVTDTTGRPLFPMVGAGNALGSMSLNGDDVTLPGLRSIFTTAITGSSIWMGNELSFEAYSYAFPVLESIEPSVFGRQVAVAEALGFWRPVANSAVKIG